MEHVPTYSYPKFWNSWSESPYPKFGVEESLTSGHIPTTDSDTHTPGHIPTTDNDSHTSVHVTEASRYTWSSVKLYSDD